MMNLLDIHIVHKIRYEYLQNPKKDYDSIIAYMNSVFRKTCSSKCRFRHFSVMDGQIIYRLMLVRQTHAPCCICGNSVSEYQHDYCYKCAPITSVEFMYHHTRCSL